MNSSSPIGDGELHTTQGERHTRIGGNELLPISGVGNTVVDGTRVIQARPQARVTATSVLVNAGANLTLKASRQRIVTNFAEVFNSMSIVQGGTPMAGIASQQALQALAKTARAVVVNPLFLVAAARQRAVSLCPLCEICRDGPYRIGDVA